MGEGNSSRMTSLKFWTTGSKIPFVLKHRDLTRDKTFDLLKNPLLSPSPQEFIFLIPEIFICHFKLYGLQTRTVVIQRSVEIRVYYDSVEPTRILTTTWTFVESHFR